MIITKNKREGGNEHEKRRKPLRLYTHTHTHTQVLLQIGNKIIENSAAQNKAVVFGYGEKNVVADEVCIIFRKIII